jgi:hypothetical protein
VVEPEQLAARAGIEPDPRITDRLVELGIAEWLEDGRLRLPNPELVRAGLDVIRLGVPVDRILEMLPKLLEHSEAVSKLYVDLFRDTVWRGFADAGMPAEGWPEIQRTIEQVIPLAGQALVASFRAAMLREIEMAAGEELGLDPHALPSAG